MARKKRGNLYGAEARTAALGKCERPEWVGSCGSDSVCLVVSKLLQLTGNRQVYWSFFPSPSSPCRPREAAVKPELDVHFSTPVSHCVPLRPLR